MAGYEGCTVIVGLNGLRLLASSAWRRAQTEGGAMSRPGRDGGATAGCTVTVCRGCCCGTAAGFDHAGQLTRLRTAVANVAVVRLSGCLDTCAHANLIVV